MGEHRFNWGRAGRRGGSRAVFLLLTLALIAAGGCGPSGEGAKTDPEKGSDAEHLNVALEQELELLHGYTRVVPRLNGESQAVARRFRGHQQEYVDAITKALRGLGAEVEAEPTLATWTGDEAQPDLLARLYRLEGALLIAHVDAVPGLHTAAPRTLAASLAAAHAAHRVVLRRLLAVPAVDLAPEAFDSGEEPLPRAGR
ncbi:MAG TPA: ferritin-like domain-containing protein [Solirubrobacterales bacterium]|nr:ferritin-like domain-containing protein [Solirubrobacterales bacterium]